MLDLALVRSRFPALKAPRIFLDNPGGTQIARQSLDRMRRYLLECNANHGGEFATSRASDAVIAEARQAMADFLNASSPDEIVFGANMTTLTFQISRALAPAFRPGETIVLTRLDHDANISPWLRVAEERNLNVRWVDFDPRTGILDLADFALAMETRPRLVAFGYASNALGTINPAAELSELARKAGALVYIDAVQYAPHGPIDVQDLDCDFLVCSSYKFFGPHAGILWGRYELLERLRAYRVRPAPAEPPGKFETGTGNFEGIAGVLGAVEYYEWLGRRFGAEFDERIGKSPRGRKRLLRKAALAVRAYEHTLSSRLLETLLPIKGLQLYGPSDPSRVDQRVSTFSFTLARHSPEAIARHLDQAGINTWNGNFYALAVTTRLGLEASGGLLRVGAVHYNTLEEIDQFGSALRDLVSR